MNDVSKPQSRLVGRWRQVFPVTSESVTITFTPEGKLVYTIDTGDKKEIMNLLYEVRADMIVTDQPSAPQREQTKYIFESDDDLVLDYNGEVSRFRAE